MNYQIIILVIFFVYFMLRSATFLDFSWTSSYTSLISSKSSRTGFPLNRCIRASIIGTCGFRNGILFFVTNPIYRRWQHHIHLQRSLRSRINFYVEDTLSTFGLVQNPIALLR
eukprot:UN12352